MASVFLGFSTWQLGNDGRCTSCKMPACEATISPLTKQIMNKFGRITTKKDLRRHVIFFTVASYLLGIVFANQPSIENTHLCSCFFISWIGWLPREYEQVWSRTKLLHGSSVVPHKNILNRMSVTIFLHIHNFWCA